MEAGAAAGAARLAPQAGAHVCLTFGETAEFWDLTAAVIGQGLQAGLKVAWLSDASPGRAAGELACREIPAGPATTAGQLAAGSWEVLLSGQGFRAGTAAGWLAAQAALSRQQGFPGLRVVLDMSWALRPVPGAGELPGFEQRIAGTLAGTAASVVCQYDRRRFDPVTLASAAAVHTATVAAATYHDDPVLRIRRQYAPPGIVIAGEIDYQAGQPLGRALAEAVRLGGDLDINMSGLSFIDARCALLIARASRAVAGSRAVRLRCRPEIAARSIRPCVAGIPQVQVIAR